VADNRVVAGIHYPVDIDAGRAVAIACFNKLKKLDSIIELQAEVAKELKQYA
jgi:membrane-associated phospholipid phosphatase